MTSGNRCIVSFAALAVAALVMTASAQALTMSECSAKYKAAQGAGSLKGQSWNEFRKAECAASTSDAAAKPAPASTVATTATPAAVAAAGPAKFPTAVDAKYAKEKPGKARLKTCADQYRANKAANGNGGLKWIEKGGGYYSQCSKRLKGSTSA